MAETNEATIERPETSSGLCARCGVAPSAVLDNQLALCGPCYHNETLRQWTRRTAMRRSGNPAADSIHELEVAIWKLITPCDCVEGADE